MVADFKEYSNIEDVERKLDGYKEVSVVKDIEGDLKFDKDIESESVNACRVASRNVSGILRYKWS